MISGIRRDIGKFKHSLMHGGTSRIVKVEHSFELDESTSVNLVIKLPREMFQ